VTLRLVKWNLISNRYLPLLKGNNFSIAVIFLPAVLLSSFSTLVNGQTVSEYPLSDTFSERLPPVLGDYDLVDLPPDETWMDITEEFVSESVHDIGTYLDHNIAKKEQSEKALNNRSFLQIRSQSGYSHRGYYDAESKVRLRIDFPHVQENWKIVIETSPEEYDSLESKKRDLNSEAKSSGAIGGVRLEEKQISHWKTNFDIGIKVKFPLDPFVRADVRRVENMTDKWVFGFKQELFLFNSLGAGTLTDINFYYPLNQSESKIFKSSSSAQYLYDDLAWELLHQFQIFDRLDEDNLMEYATGIDYEPDEDDEISNYWISTTWRHNLHKSWLFLSVKAQLDAPREFGYKMNPGVLIELEAFFSKNRKVDRLLRSIPESTHR